MLTRAPLLLSLCCFLVAGAAHALPRVYVAPLHGSTADPGVLALVEDRVLVAARALADRYDVLGAADVRGILDAEAAQAALGCDASSCLNEVADALNADELVIGQLGHIGETWQLTLTRTHRRTLRVVGRAVRESRGQTPEGLLSAIPDQVRELFPAPAPAPSALGLVGVSAAIAGALTALVGGGLYALSWSEYGAASSALASDPQDVADARAHVQTGEAVLPWSWALAGAGVVAVVVGAGLFALAPAEER